MHCEINRLLSQSGKSALIAKSVELINMIKEIHEKPITSFQRSPVNAEFPSEIVPEYEMASFEIENFEQIRLSSEVIYSEAMQCNNLT